MALPSFAMVRAEFARWMLDERGYAPSTRRSYSEKAAQAERFMLATFGRRLLLAKQEHAKAYLASFGWPKTRNVHLTMLKAYFRFAVERGYRSPKTNPTLGIGRLPEPRYLPRPLSLEEVRRLRRAAITLGLRSRVVLDIGLFTGARRSEIARLRWADVDIAGKRIRVFGKGRKEGVLPLHSELATELDLWRLVAPSEAWVFPSPQGTPGRHLSSETIWGIVSEIGQRAGVKVQPHQLRHTFATELLEQGSDIRRVQELLRHASLSSTQLYTSVAVGRLEEDIERLDYGT